jgi:hypothetical protein
MVKHNAKRRMLISWARKFEMRPLNPISNAVAI